MKNKLIFHDIFLVCCIANKYLAPKTHSIDDLVEMPLSGKAERIRILNLYKDVILMNDKQNDSMFVNSVANILTPKAIEQIAIDTKGLSVADILEPAIVTMPLVNRIVQDAVIKYFSFTGGKLLGIVED